MKKYHNHKLQKTPWHHEEEPHNNHREDKLSKATPSLSLSLSLSLSQYDNKTKMYIM